MLRYTAELPYKNIITYSTSISQAISRLFCKKFKSYIQFNTDFNGLSSNGKTHGFDPCTVGSSPTSPACLGNNLLSDLIECLLRGGRECTRQQI